MREIRHFPAPVGQLGWFETARNKSHAFARVEDLQASYDFVVVGAGFAGISAAWRLTELRPGASVAVFDAIPVGMGDSGRNAGFLIDIPHATVGDPEADLFHHQWRFRLNRLVIDRLRRIKTDHHLDFDWRECGKHLAAREARHLGSLETLARLLDALKTESRFLDSAELACTLGTDYYIRSLHTPGTVLINPAEAVRALAAALPRNVQVFESTPVSQVNEGAIPGVVVGGKRKVSAGKVIVTVSAFINHFGIREAGRMFGVASFGAMTRELNDEEVSAIGNVDPWGCTSAHPAGTTVRYTATRRVFVRNGLSFCGNQHIPPARVDRSHGKLRKAFENRFPKLRHVPFEHVYGGTIPLTANAQSLFGSVARNVFAGAVGDGLGLTRSNMLGLFLADMACGLDSEELRYLQSTNSPGWCPPEPFRTIGANLRLAVSEFRAGGEV